MFPAPHASAALQKHSARLAAVQKGELPPKEEDGTACARAERLKALREIVGPTRRGHGDNTVVRQRAVDQRELGGKSRNSAPARRGRLSEAAIEKRVGDCCNDEARILRETEQKRGQFSSGGRATKGLSRASEGRQM